MTEISKLTGVSLVTLSRIKHNRVGYIRIDTFNRIIAVYPTVTPGDFYEVVEDADVDLS